MGPSSKCQPVCIIEYVCQFVKQAIYQSIPPSANCIFSSSLALARCVTFAPLTGAHPPMTSSAHTPHLTCPLYHPSLEK